jgi:hypothetical protein
MEGKVYRAVILPLFEPGGGLKRLPGLVFGTNVCTLKPDDHRLKNHFMTDHGSTP